MLERFAVIGASSFSGRSFCRYLRALGIAPLELSRPAYDLNKSHDAFERALCWGPDTPEYVVNFAALNVVADSWKHYADYYQTNVVGISRLAGLLSGLKSLKRYVHISTPEVYGTTQTFLKEDAPYRPSTPYAVSRAAADMHMLALHRATGFPVSITRSVNVYGRGQQIHRVIPKTVLKILRGERLQLHGGGISTRSFIHIDDVSASVLAVARRGRSGEIYHTSTARQTSIRELVEAICKLMGARFADVVEPWEERVGKDMAYQLDSGKIRAELGWEDKIELESGLADAVAWFIDHEADFAGQPLEYRHVP